LVENVEAIIAEEQQVYWRNRGGQDGGARQIGAGSSRSIREGSGAGASQR
jgi:hypothetical protein